MRLDRRSVILGGASTALSACMNEPGRAGKTQADMILHGGQVLTVDDKFSKRTAVAVKDGKILATGGPELLNNFDAPVKADLAGRTLMPGFTDCHVHIYSIAPRAIEPDKPKSIAELKDMLRAKARELGKGEWITGYGWDEALWTERRNPTRADLDAAAPEDPGSAHPRRRAFRPSPTRWPSRKQTSPGTPRTRKAASSSAGLTARQAV